MNILLVSSYLPYPLFSGGHIRLYNLIKQLSHKHSITLICEKRSYQTKEDIKEIEKFCKKVITIPRKKQWTIKNMLLTGFSADPFLIVGHTSESMKTTIRQLLENEAFDLIHVETFYVLQNIPETKISIILTEHNIEYMVYKRYADNAMPLLRPFLYFDVLWKLKRKEEMAWKRVDKLIAVSEEDKRVMDRKDVAIVPNGVDTERFVFNNRRKRMYHSVAKQMQLPEKELLFIGDFKWLQNRDTVRWIIQDIWPFLLRAVEGETKIKLRIVGRNIPEALKQINSFDSIVFDTNASKDTTEIFKDTDVLLAPIRVGGGTSYKILESMASGIPVVTTHLGLVGLGAESDNHAIAADDVQSIVEKTARLLRDDELYDTIAHNARLLIEEKYDWKKIGKKLDEVYESVK